MPGLSLTNTSYRDIRNSSVLALGISEGNLDFNALPFVENEIFNISKLWNGKFLLNEESTLEKITLREQDNKIIHIASNAKRSWIRLWGEQIKSIDFSRKIDWYNPPVELLVLSSCETGLGRDYGLAGLVIQEGVKSVLGSLYDVQDKATMFMMTEFYRHLKSAPVKVEALRQAQLTMIQSEEFSNPFYWAGFTMIGNPW